MEVMMHRGQDSHSHLLAFGHEYIASRKKGSFT